MLDPVFVTGASGFVGSCAVRRLLERGHQVHVLLRAEARLWRLRGLLERLVVHRADLCDAAAVRAAVSAATPAVVLHLAAYGAYETQADARRILETDVLGSYNLLEASPAAGVKVFVNAGSSSEYGYRYDVMRESDALVPNSIYAVAKAAQTHLCSLLGQSGSGAFVTFRLFSVYGPWEEPVRLMPTIIRRARAGLPLEMVAPETAHDFIYVDDVLDAMLDFERLAGSRGAVYNLGSGVQSTLRDVVAAVQAAVGSKSEVRWGAHAGPALGREALAGRYGQGARGAGLVAQAHACSGRRAHGGMDEHRGGRLPAWLKMTASNTRRRGRLPQHGRRDAALDYRAVARLQRRARRLRAFDRRYRGRAVAAASCATPARRTPRATVSSWPRGTPSLALYSALRFQGLLSEALFKTYCRRRLRAGRAPGPCAPGRGLVHGFAGPEPLRGLRAGLRLPAEEVAGAGLRAGQRRRVQRGADVGGGHVRRAPRPGRAHGGRGPERQPGYGPDAAASCASISGRCGRLWAGMSLRATATMTRRSPPLSRTRLRAAAPQSRPGQDRDGQGRILHGKQFRMALSQSHAGTGRPGAA